jgi:hypothetical protein
VVDLVVFPRAVAQWLAGAPTSNALLARQAPAVRYATRRITTADPQFSPLPAARPVDSVAFRPASSPDWPAGAL